MPKRNRNNTDGYNFKPVTSQREVIHEPQAKKDYQCVCGSSIKASEVHSCNLGIAQYDRKDRIYSVRIT